MTNIQKSLLTLFISATLLNPIFAQTSLRPVIDTPLENLKTQIDTKASAIEPKLIEWRRHFHENPELGNREFKTAEYVIAHLKKFSNIEIRSGVAFTGIVATLKGGKPGPVVALRADMDALPVVERVKIPFASKVRSTYNKQDVGVMHACGHDTHVAMLMAAAELLSGMQKDIHGTIVFLFQPAEEGAPDGEEGGAKLMIKEGCMDNPKVDVAFGLHISSGTEVGTITYKPAGAMAASDELRIKIKGKQTHGASPWNGVDPIVVSAQVINGLQTIISRQINLTNEAAVITIGKINGGVRNNIIPEEVEMIGTIRTLDTEMQDDIHARIRNTAEKIAESMGAKAEVIINRGYPVTYNDPKLTEMMLPSVKEAAGADHVKLVHAATGAEDFSFYAQKVPGLFLFLGGMPKGQEPSTAAPHHTPDFFVDESSMKLGVRTLCYLALDYAELKK
jgi:amidohydrolase